MNDNRIKLRKKVFFAGLFLYCVPTILQTTLLVETSYWNDLFVYLRYLAFYFGLILIVDEHVTWNKRKRFPLELVNVRKSVWCLAILAVTGISALISGDRSFLACVVFTMAAENIDLDQIVKTIFFMISTVLLIITGLSGYGTIEDMMFKRQDVLTRHALGFDYPSTVMSYLFFAVVLYCWITEMKLTLIEVITIELLNLILFKLTDSRFGFLLIAVLVAGVYLWGLVQKNFIVEDIFKNRRVRFITDYAGVLLSVVTLIMCIIYPTGLGKLFDRFLSKRIQYMVAGFRNYGVHLFGKHIDWIGFGGSDNTDSLLKSYNFVDNSYAKILLDQGLLIFILVLVILIIMNKIIRKQYHDGRIVLVLFVLLYSFVEPRLLHIYVNPFLFAAAPFIRGTFLEEKDGKFTEWYKMINKE
ncbi:hypothetical protein WMO28_03245 [Blautia sp. CLA-JM-H16]|uniref:Polymerase n=1 Tax=Blautia aquisgranensis TaxID=3133153 RepID=A0ABV1BCK0_9FIRM